VRQFSCTDTPASDGRSSTVATEAGLFVVFARTAPASDTSTGAHVPGPRRSPRPHSHGRTAMTEAMPPHVSEQKLAEAPMQRVGEPDEIASFALFYASGLSSYMTGSVAEVTGGHYM
jgi:NAD(P)-dependent dehydrogenase (short-subunit alcohol dehydrogenase family)